MMQKHIPQPNGPKPKSVLVWDKVVRIFHWTIVTGFMLDMFVLAEGKTPHRWVGYVILAAIAVRLVWGFIGTPHARYNDFIPMPKRVVGYVKSLMKGTEPRYVGHNPAGALMIIALVVMLLTCCITGWMQGLDRFWGVEWLQQLHELTANGIMALAVVHVLAAIIESFRHKENLIKSMVTGRKRAAQGMDVDYANPVD